MSRTELGHLVSKQIEFAIDDYAVDKKGIHGVIADRTNNILGAAEQWLTAELEALAASNNWRVLLEDRLYQLQNTKEARK